MGMHDYIKLPGIAKMLNLKDEHFQTKSLPCTLDNYVVQEGLLLLYRDNNDEKSKITTADFTGEVYAYNKEANVKMCFVRGLLHKLEIEERA